MPKPIRCKAGGSSLSAKQRPGKPSFWRAAGGAYSLCLDKLKGVISESDYIALSQDLSAQCRRLEQLTAAGNTQRSRLEAQLDADGNPDPAAYCIPLTHLTREMMESLIDYISIGRRAPGSREVPVEIHWSF